MLANILDNHIRKKHQPKVIIHRHVKHQRDLRVNLHIPNPILIRNIIPQLQHEIGQIRLI